MSSFRPLRGLNMSESTCLTERTPDINEMHSRAKIKIIHQPIEPSSSRLRTSSQKNLLKKKLLIPQEKEKVHTSSKNLSFSSNLSKHSKKMPNETPKESKHKFKKYVVFADAYGNPLVDVVEIESFKQYYDYHSALNEGQEMKKRTVCTCSCLIL